MNYSLLNWNIIKTSINLLKNRSYYWLNGYFQQQAYLKKHHYDINSITDIIFLVVDHFEPSRNKGVLGIDDVDLWCKNYIKIAEKHTDSDNYHPQHTWFYRYDYPNPECLDILSRTVFSGYGEIEFHLHHSFDNSSNFENTIREGLAWFSTFGAMNSFNGNNFAYIAGNWALNNGRNNDRYSGVDNEIKILDKYGCYADFTFPAYSVNSQPQLVNYLYYTNPDATKGLYKSGQISTVGIDSSDKFLIFQGPLFIDWHNYFIEYSSVENFMPYNPSRVSYWLNAGIHVLNRPEWIFIKLHTHGMQSKEYFLSNDLDIMFSQLEELSVKKGIRLHYVTSREAYNIVKAAEADKKGNAGNFRDFKISKPLNRIIYSSSPYVIDTSKDFYMKLKFIDKKRDIILEFADFEIDCLTATYLDELKIYINGQNQITIEAIGYGNLQVSSNKNNLKKQYNLSLDSKSNGITTVIF